MFAVGHVGLFGSATGRFDLQPVQLAAAVRASRFTRRFPAAFTVVHFQRRFSSVANREQSIVYANIN